MDRDTHIHLHVDREGNCKQFTTNQFEYLERMTQHIMAKLEDVKAGQDAIAATAKKAFAEIRAKLDSLLAKQADVEKLVADAKAAQQAEDSAAFETALDAVVAKNAEIKSDMTALDDIVPDAPVTPTP